MGSGLIWIYEKKFDFLIDGSFLKIYFLYLVYMTHGKKSKTIYTDLKYNRYMTDDRNRKSRNPVSKFCIQDNCNNEAIYNYWGMKPEYCIDHKKDYHINIYKNPVSKNVIMKIVIKQLYIII